MQCDSRHVMVWHDGQHVVVMWCNSGYIAVVRCDGQHIAVMWHGGGCVAVICGMTVDAMWSCSTMVVTCWSCHMAVVTLWSWWGCGGSHIVLWWLHGMVVAGSCMA